MAERRRRKKKGAQELEKPTKEEEAVAKHLRFNLPTKTTSIEGTKVEYFTGSKAVDFMLDSKWASGKGKTEILFTDRNSVTKYLDRLLWKGLYYRALKVVKKPKKEGKDKEGKEKEGKEKEGKEEKKKSKKEKKKEAESAGKGEEKEKEEGKGEGTEAKDGGKEGTPQPKKKEGGKKKIKLEPTEDQKFVDGNDAFVWVYDPVRPMNYVYGALLVIGAITVCLFPLWPPWMRVGTYYLSLGGAGLVGIILALAVIRVILFVLTWGGTFGKIHFWLFPNLLADVGIKESFIPFYECEFMTKQEQEDKKDKEKSSDGDNKDDDQSPSVDKTEENTSQDTTATKEIEDISQGNGELDEELSSKEAENGAGITNEEEYSQNTDLNDAEEEEDNDDEGDDDDDDDDDEEEEDDEDRDDSGDGFEVIEADEISEVIEGSGASQNEEEE